MDNSEVEKDFDEYKCSYEEFRGCLLLKYINEPDYNNYVTILESIIKCEMNRDQYDRTKNTMMDFLDEEDENFYRRMEIKDQFEQWVKDYTEFKDRKKLMELSINIYYIWTVYIFILFIVIKNVTIFI